MHILVVEALLILYRLSMEGKEIYILLMLALPRLTGDALACLIDDALLALLG